MKISVKKSGDVAAAKADVLVVATHRPAKASEEGLGPMDAALDGLVARVIADGEFTGALGQAVLLHTTHGLKATRVLLVGTGDGDRDALRDAGAAAGSRVRELGLATAGLVAAGWVTSEIAAFAQGFAYGNYRFDRYRTGDGRAKTAASLAILGGPVKNPEARRLTALTDAVAAARDLVNTPANDMTPTALAERARELAAAHPGLSCRVLGRPELTRQKAGAMLAVAQGSAEPPAMIVLTYAPRAAKGDDVLGLVGKAVTFDTGGISIKPSSGMEEMKMDMGGGAAVIEALGLLAELDVPVRAVGVVGATENMPSGTAVKPGDVVTAMNGKTIEVINTDAEGRLVLADCLTYAVTKGKATRLVDFATLTGAMVIALGEVYAGLFASDDGWADTVRAAGRSTGDLVWRMPMHRRYDELIRSKVADLSNSANKRLAPGATYAAQFLREFTDGRPWCHVDIAGTGMPGGQGSGFGVGLCLGVAEELARRAQA